MSSNATCPHQHIRFCPLYVESHNTRGLGCVDDVAAPCRVARGKLPYPKAVAALRQIDPRLVAICEFNETAYNAREQKSRNMRLLGIH